MIKLSKNMNGRIRFKAFGIVGFYAKRKYKSRGFGIERQRTFTQIHLGKRSIAIETSSRFTHNFAGR